MVAALFAAAILVHGNTVISDRDPHVRVAVPASARYAGSDRFTLFGIANCRLFAFVQSDARKSVQKLYWIQFEGYLPSLPKLQHTYTSTNHAKLGGLDFYVDIWTESSLPRRPDLTDLKSALRAKGYAMRAHADKHSDYQHIYALLQSKGYRLPERMSSVRLVHLLDNKRKELMIIYSEPAPLRPLDVNALIRRAEVRINVSP
jgi:hypothetical protein